QWLQQLIVILIVSGVLAGVVGRSRRLVRSQTRAARERTNLARYFSPNMVEALVRSDQPLGRGRSQEIAVLFADIQGFTRLAENEAPERVLDLLREFHRRAADEVFAHDGTLDKYIGDAVMATFGTPARGRRDASNALACARAMRHAMAAWSDERRTSGLAPVSIGVGVHFGPAVLGDVGDERRLEFTVIGDTVNVASRLERLTRELRADIVVSQDLVDAVHAESGGKAPDLSGFEPGEARPIRGRDGLVRVWTATSTSPGNGGPPFLSAPAVRPIA
ncbi:MAG: adenylate/guanylate cyclase domain-containing protein, partial [Alphaproteobacteria bacterium]